MRQTSSVPTQATLLLDLIAKEPRVPVRTAALQALPHLLQRSPVLDNSGVEVRSCRVLIVWCTLTLLVGMPVSDCTRNWPSACCEWRPPRSTESNVFLRVVLWPHS